MEILSSITVIGVAQTLMFISLGMLIVGMFVFVSKNLPEKDDD